jgi:hypothetical protein
MHATNLTVSGGTAAVAANATAVSALIGWLTPLAIFAGLCVSCAMFYKTMIVIRNEQKEGKLLDIQLADKSRRKEDKA